MTFTGVNLERRSWPVELTGSLRWPRPPPGTLQPWYVSELAALEGRRHGAVFTELTQREQTTNTESSMTLDDKLSQSQLQNGWTTFLLKHASESSPVLQTGFYMIPGIPNQHRHIFYMHSRMRRLSYLCVQTGILISKWSFASTYVLTRLLCTQKDFCIASSDCKIALACFNRTPELYLEAQRSR